MCIFKCYKWLKKCRNPACSASTELKLQTFLAEINDINPLIITGIMVYKHRTNAFKILRTFSKYDTATQYQAEWLSIDSLARFLYCTLPPFQNLSMSLPRLNLPAPQIKAKPAGNGEIILNIVVFLCLICGKLEEMEPSQSDVLRPAVLLSETPEGLCSLPSSSDQIIV